MIKPIIKDYCQWIDRSTERWFFWMEHKDLSGKLEIPLHVHLDFWKIWWPCLWILCWSLCVFVLKTRLSFHTLEQEVETKYWYWNGNFLQVLQILLRDDVVARARITASEVCTVLFAMSSDYLVSSPYCKLSCSYLSSLFLHFQQKRAVISFTHQFFHIIS